MGKMFVIRSDEVMPFQVSEAYTSKMLIDKHNSGTDGMQVNEGVVKAGCRLPGAAHPEPYDELYIVMKGEAILHLDEDVFEIEPGTVIFIPWAPFTPLKTKAKLRILPCLQFGLKPRRRAAMRYTICG